LLRAGDVISASDLPPDADETRLVIRFQQSPEEVASLRLDLRLLKPIDLQTWGLVEASHRNVLAFDQLEEARERSALLELRSATGDQ
jgi:hypothetical protein